MGLYISKGLVKQHGGRISAESTGQGCGLTFTIELPLYHCPGHVCDRTSNSSDDQHSLNPGAKSISTGHTVNSTTLTSTTLPSLKQHHCSHSHGG